MDNQANYIPTLAVEIGIGVYCKEDESENGESING